MVEIILRVSMKDVSHPGINQLPPFKQVGSISRHLFLLALDDIKEGEQQTASKCCREVSHDYAVRVHALGIDAGRKPLMILTTVCNQECIVPLIQE
jgi:hypothetical protein